MMNKKTSVSKNKTKKSKSVKPRRKRFSIRDLFLVTLLLLLLPVLVYAALQTTQTRQKAAPASTSDIINGGFEDGKREINAWVGSCPTSNVLGVSVATTDYTKYGDCGDAVRKWGCYKPDYQPNPNNPGFSIPRCPGWPGSGYNERVPSSIMLPIGKVTSCQTGYVCCTSGAPVNPPPADIPISCTLTANPTGKVSINQKVELKALCTGGSGTYTNYSWFTARYGGGTGTGAIYEKDGNVDNQVKFASETPGTFNVSVIVTDSKGKDKMVSVQIVVTDSALPPGQKPDLIPYNGVKGTTNYRGGISLDQPDLRSFHLALQNAGDVDGSGNVNVRYMMIPEEAPTSGDLVAWFNSKYEIYTRDHDLTGSTLIRIPAKNAITESVQNLPATTLARFPLGTRGSTCMQIDYNNVVGEKSETNNVGCQKIPNCSLGEIANGWDPVGISSFSTTPQVNFTVTDGPSGKPNLNNLSQAKAQKVTVLEGKDIGISQDMTGKVPVGSLVTTLVYPVRGEVTIWVQRDGGDSSPIEFKANKLNQWNYFSTYVSPSDPIPTKITIIGNKGAQFYVDDVMSAETGTVDLAPHGIVVNAEKGKDMSISFAVNNYSLKEERNQSFAVRAYFDGQDVVYNEPNGSKKIELFNKKYYETDQSHKREISLNNVYIPSTGGPAAKYIDKLQFSRAFPEGFDKMLYFCVYVDSGSNLIEEQEGNNVLCERFDPRRQPDDPSMECYLRSSKGSYNEPIIQAGETLEFSVNCVHGSTPYTYVWNRPMLGTLTPQSDQSKANYVSRAPGSQLISVTVKDSGSQDQTKSMYVNVTAAPQKPELVAFTGDANGRTYKDGLAFESNPKLVHYAVTNDGYSSFQGRIKLRFVVLDDATNANVISKAQDGFSRFESFDSNWKATSDIIRTLELGINAYNVVEFTGNLSTLDSSTSFVCMQIDSTNAASELNENNNVTCRSLSI